jgi:hypothetical protein
MHRPPAVSFPVERSDWSLGFILLSGILAALILFLWAQSQNSIRSFLIVLGVLASVEGLALRAWWTAPTGRLGWDGESWFWSGFGDAALSSLTVVVDLQVIALVQIQDAAGKAAWLWLESRTFDARWLALRRALVASA